MGDEAVDQARRPGDAGEVGGNGVYAAVRAESRGSQLDVKTECSGM